MATNSALENGTARLPGKQETRETLAYRYIACPACDSLLENNHKFCVGTILVHRLGSRKRSGTLEYGDKALPDAQGLPYSYRIIRAGIRPSPTRRNLQRKAANSALGNSLAPGRSSEKGTAFGGPQFARSMRVALIRRTNPSPDSCRRRPAGSTCTRGFRRPQLRE